MNDLDNLRLNPHIMADARYRWLFDFGTIAAWLERGREKSL